MRSGSAGTTATFAHCRGRGKSSSTADGGRGPETSDPSAAISLSSSLEPLRPNADVHRMIPALPRRRQHRAGRHADEWFWTTYRPWRRKARIAFALIAPPLAALLMSLSAIWPSWWQFYAGATLGVLMTMYVCLIDSPPDWIDRKRRGRDGERRTEQRLKPLERSGWRVAHDIVRGRGNVDHIAVGPPGVYLLETKQLDGEASIVDGMLTIMRGNDDRDAWTPRPAIGDSVRGAAVRLRNDLLQATGIRFVQGVVVLWCDFPAGVVESERVVYVHGDQLHGWLGSRPPRLRPATIAGVGDWLEEAEAVSLQLDDASRLERTAASAAQLSDIAPRSGTSVAQRPLSATSARRCRRGWP